MLMEAVELYSNVSDLLVDRFIVTEPSEIVSFRLYILARQNMNKLREQQQ